MGNNILRIDFIVNNNTKTLPAGHYLCTKSKKKK